MFTDTKIDCGVAVRDLATEQHQQIYQFNGLTLFSRINTPLSLIKTLSSV